MHLFLFHYEVSDYFTHLIILKRVCSFRGALLLFYGAVVHCCREPLMVQSVQPRSVQLVPAVKVPTQPASTTGGPLLQIPPTTQALPVVFAETNNNKARSCALSFSSSHPIAVIKKTPKIIKKNQNFLHKLNSLILMYLKAITGFLTPKFQVKKNLILLIKCKWYLTFQESTHS